MSAAAIHLFPVRHHSPRAAACLRALLDQVRPRLLLIEGPSDANALIPVLTDAQTEPPVAILAYRTEGEPQSAMWPFARYSPEFQALLWAHENGAEARFIDWPAGVALAVDASRADDEDDDEDDEDDDDDGAGEADQSDSADQPTTQEHYQQLAEQFGLRHFDEFWDAWFETPQYQPEGFAAALTAYAEWTAGSGGRDQSSAQRDLYMAARIEAALGEGYAPNEVVAVLGAAHVAALLGAELPTQPPPPAALSCALAVVPYSYPRLSEASGYGAGNRAPWYYERVYQGELDFARATLVVLLEFAASMRLRGFAVSLADVIEAYRLSLSLAAMRDKSAPGVDELAEAAQATLARGEAAPIREFLQPLLIGKRIGKLGAAAGKNSLQREFAEGLAEFGLPSADEAETLTLRLTDSKHAAASLFLHRLRVSDVPYASYAGSQSVVSRGPDSDDEAGGYAALNRSREHWELQWTPATEVALAERVIYGERFDQVCQRRLSEAIGGASHAADATRLLIDAVLTDCSGAIASALDAAERLSSLDDDVASLAQAARTLAALTSFGSSRPLLKQVGNTVERLLVGTYTRAILRLEAALGGDAEATQPARAAMLVINELALSQALCDRQRWIQALAEIAADQSLEASASGVACALLYLSRELSEEQLRELLAGRLGDVLNPSRAADFLAGFFEVNALVLLKNREIVAALSDFLSALEPEHFRDALPALRRAFALLGASERRFLTEHLVALHAAAAPAAGAAVISAADSAALADLGDALGDALDDLDDLL